MADITEKTLAGELREIAHLLRAGAAAARESMDRLPGPSYPTADAFQVALGRQFPVSRGMCEHIARWTPEAAEELASWLEEVADEAEHHEAQGMGNAQDEVVDGPCLAVARVLNGGAR